MSDAGSQASPDVLAEFERIRAGGEDLAARMRAAQLQLAAEFEQFTGPAKVRAAVTLREDGLVEHLSLERERDATAAEVRAAINDAFALARARDTALPLEAVDALLEVASGSLSAPTERVADDLGRLAVTALFGDVVQVEADSRWLESTPDGTVAAEILRVAREAALMSDRYARFEQGG